jgi:acyl carrier protein
MSKNSTTSEVLAWIAEIFEEPLENIRPEVTKEEIKSWDSLGVLTLMAGLDENYEILLTEEEILELKSIEDVLTLLRKHGKLKED